LIVATFFLLSDLASRPHSFGLTAGCSTRYPKVVYTAEGRKLADRLWSETMKEFETADIGKIVGNSDWIAK
jgi:hypothetical protein